MEGVNKSWKSTQQIRVHFLEYLSEAQGDSSHQDEGEEYRVLSLLCSHVLAPHLLFTIISFTKRRLKSWRGSHQQGRKIIEDISKD